MNLVLSDDKQVLWDIKNELVLAMKQGDREFSTGAPRPSDAETKWFPVMFGYPEEMVPGHPQLLGPSVFEYDPGIRDDVILETFPEADFSPDAFRRYAQDRTRDAAQQTLSSTDWFVTREMETGKQIPDEIRAARAKVREAADADLARLERLTPTEFAEFQPTNVHAAAVDLGRTQRELRGYPSKD